MAIIETRIYECDCCGRQSKSEELRAGNLRGSVNLSLSGNIFGDGYSGSWHETTYDIKKLLCPSCAKEVRELLVVLIRQHKIS